MGGLPYLPRIWDQVALLKTDYIQYLMHLKGNICTPCVYDARTNMLYPMTRFNKIFSQCFDSPYRALTVVFLPPRTGSGHLLAGSGWGFVYAGYGYWLYRIEGLQLTRSGFWLSRCISRFVYILVNIYICVSVAKFTYLYMYSEWSLLVTTTWNLAAQYFCYCHKNGF